MLEVDPKRRISASNALKHNFFKYKLIPSHFLVEKKKMNTVFENLKTFSSGKKMQTALKSYLANFFLQEKYEQDLNRIFQEIDKDKSGTLSREEFKQASNFFGANTNLLDEEVDKIFDLVDTNGNGQIDYSEFVACATSISNLMSEK
jgi:Ca2+-binding EF-hand superfamily protein